MQTFFLAVDHYLAFCSTIEEVEFFGCSDFHDSSLLSHGPNDGVEHAKTKPIGYTLTKAKDKI